MSARVFTKEEVEALTHRLRLSLTEDRERSWYGDSWTETRPDMSAITQLVNVAVAEAATAPKATPGGPTL